MRIVLLGGGGHASDVLGALEAIAESPSSVSGNGFKVVGILADDEVNSKRFAHRGVKQIGHIDDLKHVDATHYISCVGYPKGRKSVADRTSECQLTPFTLIHPRAWVAADVVIGPGTVVLAHACLSPGVVIGSHAYISNGSLLGHDCQVSDFVSVMPGGAVSGDTHLKKGCLIGTNSTVLERLTVGEWSVIGAGAVVTSNIPANVVAKGMPARFNRT